MPFRSNQQIKEDKAIPAALGHLQTYFFDSAPSSAGPASAATGQTQQLRKRPECGGVFNARRGKRPSHLLVTGRSETAGSAGRVGSTWLPAVGPRAGSGPRCLVHTSVTILEPAK